MKIAGKFLSLLLLICIVTLSIAACNDKYATMTFTKKSTVSDKPTTSTTSSSDSTSNGENPTPVVPQYIYTAEELKNIESNGHYILANDIDLGGEEWIPLGTAWEAPRFMGVFDGDGHTVSNYKIIAVSDTIGLFKQNYGEIRNLGVKDFIIDISKKNTVFIGGIVGYNYGGTVENCFAEGSIISMNVEEQSSVGGITGYSSIGKVRNCYSNVDINVFSAYGGVFTGGIVGIQRDGITSNCYALGNIISETDFSDYSLLAGGVVGFNANTGEIYNCYATGNISARSLNSVVSAGGVLGYNYSETCIIENCYSFEGQVFDVLDSGMASDNPSNDHDLNVPLEKLLSVSFQKDVMLFSEENWIFTEGEHPKLK